MVKFNLLLIGDAKHQYIISFSRWLKMVFPNIFISIISTNTKNVTNTYSDFYDEVFVIQNKFKWILKIKGIRTVYRAIKVSHIIAKKKLGRDAILVHYAYPWLSLVSKRLKNKTLNFTVALWGSDFYRCRNLNNLKKILKQSDNIIIDTPQMIQDFNKKFGKYHSKVHLCYFGGEAIENLRDFKETNVTREQSCAIFKFTTDKLNVTIGHNGSEGHQHITIINKLLKLNTEIAKKIRVILPMTYGLKPDYLKKIKNICQSASFEVKIITEFLDANKVAHLRNLTDIMINLQITDSFSASMKEVLYCGGVVINGNWLPYHFLKEMGIYFVEVNSVQEISEKLNEVIMNYPYFKDKSKENSAKIYDISSWSKVITKWKEVIELKR